MKDHLPLYLTLEGRAPFVDEGPFNWLTMDCSMFLTAETVLPTMDCSNRLKTGNLSLDHIHPAAPTTAYPKPTQSNPSRINTSFVSLFKKYLHNFRIPKAQVGAA